MDFSDLSARAAESNLVFRSSFSCGFCFPCKLEFYLHESVFEWRRRNHVLSAVVLLVVFRSQAVPRQPLQPCRRRFGFRRVLLWCHLRLLRGSEEAVLQTHAPGFHRIPMSTNSEDIGWSGKCTSAPVAVTFLGSRSLRKCIDFAGLGETRDALGSKLLNVGTPAFSRTVTACEKYRSCTKHCAKTYTCESL